MTDENDLSIKEKYSADLDKKIESQKIRVDNLEGQIHQLQVKLETERKMIEQERSVKFADEKKRLASVENDLYARKEAIELKENQLKERDGFIQRQETKYSEFVKEKDLFDKDKKLFQEYRNKIEKDLELARIEMANIKAEFEKLDVEKCNIKAVAKKLDARQDDLDQQFGILEQRKREFDLYKQSEIERYQEKPQTQEETQNV
jgi:chromosome segregation ATPase